MAKDYYQSEEFKEILASYESREDKSRSVYLDADDFADIADYYLTEDQPEKAMEAVDMGLHVHPDDEVLLSVKSATFIYQRRFDEAETVLKTLDENDSDVKYQLAQLQYGKYNDSEKAEKIWCDWIRQEVDNNPTEEEIRDCYIHILSSIVELRGDYEADGERRGWDVKLVRKWVRRYIDTFQPLGRFAPDVQLVDICRENELADLMCETLGQVLEEQPYLPKGWSSYALAQFMQQNYEQAIEACDFALAIDENDIEALLTKAHAINASGDKIGSKPVFKEYLDRGGESVQIIPYAEALFLDGDREEAVAQLQTLAERFETERAEQETRLMENLNKDLTDDEREEDQRIYDDFIDLYLKIYTDIGDLYHRNEFFVESMDAYQHVLDLDPNCAEAYFMLGINNLALQRYEEAARHFAFALKWADDQVMMGIDIALTFVLNNFDTFALEVLNAVDKLASVSDSPFVANIPAAKSLTYLKMGYTDQFLRFFKIACRRTPDLVYRVYEGYFPKNMPVSQWYDYAEREMDTLLKKFSREDFYLDGFS